MKTTVKYVKLLLFLGILGGLSYCCYHFGFARGFARSTKLSAGSAIGYKIYVLKRIRTANYASAIKLLEISLAGDILLLVEKKNISSLSDNDRKLLSIIAEYREKYPWKITDDLITQKVQEILSPFSEGAN